MSGYCTCNGNSGGSFFEDVLSAPFEIIDTAIDAVVDIGFGMVESIFSDFETCANGLANPTCGQLETATACMQTALNLFPAARATSQFARYVAILARKIQLAVYVLCFIKVYHCYVIYLLNILLHRLSSAAKTTVNNGIRAAGQTLDTVENLCIQHGCSNTCAHPFGDSSSTSSNGRTCIDNSHSEVDSGGDDCSWYAWNSDQCGNFDTEYFSANSLCCACGGGTISPSTAGGGGTKNTHLNLV